MESVVAPCVRLSLRPKRCVFFIVWANPPLYWPTPWQPMRVQGIQFPQAAVATPLYFQVPWIYLSSALPLFHWASQSWGTGRGQRGNGNLLTPPPSTFLLFRAPVLHTLTGRQQGFRLQFSVSVSFLELLSDKMQLSHEQVGQLCWNDWDSSWPSNGKISSWKTKVRASQSTWDGAWTLEPFRVCSLTGKCSCGWFMSTFVLN